MREVESSFLSKRRKKVRKTADISAFRLAKHLSSTILESIPFEEDVIQLMESIKFRV